MASHPSALQLRETAIHTNARPTLPLPQMDGLKLSRVFSAAHPFPYISPVTESAEGYSQFICFTLRCLSWRLQQVELHAASENQERPQLQPSLQSHSSVYGGRFLKWSSASESHRIQERVATDTWHGAIIFQLNYRSADINTTAFLCVATARELNPLKWECDYLFKKEANPPKTFQ